MKSSFKAYRHSTSIDSFRAQNRLPTNLVNCHVNELNAEFLTFSIAHKINKKISIIRSGSSITCGAFFFSARFARRCKYFLPNPTPDSHSCNYSAMVQHAPRYIVESTYSGVRNTYTCIARSTINTCRGRPMSSDLWSHITRFHHLQGSPAGSPRRRSWIMAIDPATGWIS